MAVAQAAGVFRQDGGKIILRPHRNGEVPPRFADERGRRVRVCKQRQFILRPRHGDVEEPAVFFIFPALVARSVCRIRPGREHTVVDIEQIHPLIFQPLARMDR